MVIVRLHQGHLVTKDFGNIEMYGNYQVTWTLLNKGKHGVTFKLMVFTPEQFLSLLIGQYFPNTLFLRRQCIVKQNPSNIRK